MYGQYKALPLIWFRKREIEATEAWFPFPLCSDRCSKICHLLWRDQLHKRLEVWVLQNLKELFVWNLQTVCNINVSLRKPSKSPHKALRKPSGRPQEALRKPSGSPQKALRKPLGRPQEAFPFIPDLLHTIRNPLNMGPWIEECNFRSNFDPLWSYSSRRAWK